MTDKENEKRWNEYFYPGTQILKNNKDIRDSEKLKEEEANITFEKLFILNNNNIDINTSFNGEYLKNLHKFIFGDIYPFAGQYRNVNLRKEIGAFFSISDYSSIEDYVNDIFEKVSDGIKKCYSKFQFAQILAFLYTQLIYCHPFREGNGRTIREFVREYSIIASKKNEFIDEMELDWSKIDFKELNKNIDIADFYPDMTALLFNDALTEQETKSI